jgi:hypothetical protein
MKSNTNSHIGPIGCGCRWPAPGAFSHDRTSLVEAERSAGVVVRASVTWLAHPPVATLRGSTCR